MTSVYIIIISKFTALQLFNKRCFLNNFFQRMRHKLNRIAFSLFYITRTLKLCQLDHWMETSGFLPGTEFAESRLDGSDR